MVNTLNDDILFEDQFPDKAPQKSGHKKWLAFSFLAAFGVCLLFLNAFFQRQILIAQIKAKISYSITALNQFGWDLAYDNITFNAFPLLDLAIIRNPKIYKKDASFAWNGEKISLNNSILSPNKLTFYVDGRQNINVGGTAHDMTFALEDGHFYFSDTGNPQSFSAVLHDISVHDIVDIEDIHLAADFLSSQTHQAQLPTVKLVSEIKNAKLNGLLDYPLSQNIKKIYLQANLIGQLQFRSGFQSDLREWLAHDGHIEIEDFSINWPPLLLVGKGQMLLNEKFNPIIRLNTTSLALKQLIDDLEAKNWLDSKGVFVANILLNNKSYKSAEDDEHLTVTTPIALQDDAILIEKIVVKKFD